jgi:predicted ATP-grasp superfamily ATP-dependent carboligase
MNDHGPVGALVIGGDYQGLGIARSLGRHGVPVAVLDDERSIGTHSRYVSRSIRVGDLHDPAAALQHLLAAGRELPSRWVLYPTREETVALIAEHRDELSELFRVPTPGFGAISAAWDKRKTYRLAEQIGVPVPRYWIPDSVDDLDDVDVSEPVVVKPAIKEHFIYATKVKAWRADTAAELRDAFDRAARIVGPGEVIIQELIPGDGQGQVAYNAFFKNQAPVGSMTVRRLRQHPSDFGRASTYVESADVFPIEDHATRFLKAIDYYGLVEVEFKVDPRDGEPKLLDVNARTWGYHSLGAAAGVDFPYLLYLDQTGETVLPVTARDGVSWIRLVTDVPNAIRDLRAGALDLRGYLRTLRRVDVEAVFALDDPLPCLYELALLPYLAVKRGL